MKVSKRLAGAYREALPLMKDPLNRKDFDYISFLVEPTDEDRGTLLAYAAAALNRPRNKEEVYTALEVIYGIGMLDFPKLKKLINRATEKDAEIRGYYETLAKRRGR